MSVDEELLKRNQDSENNISETGEGGSLEKSRGSEHLKEEKYASALMKKAAEEEKKKKASKLEEKMSPIKKWSASLMRSSWLNLLPTFGLSILGVAANVFLRTIFGPKYFCRLGDEWAQLGGHDKVVEKLGGKMKMVNLAETMGFYLAIALLVLSIIAFLSVVAVIMKPVGLVLDTIVSFLEKILEGFSSVFD